ncbi:sulfotransferase, partial [Akkermansiaceae bacterium]|nr:sulfotransferase [Akkermansiaceae bacterium]
MASPITNFFDGINRLRQLPIYKGIGNGKRPQPFLIVGGPRVGSTMLQTLINSHPNAVCMHELLK